MTDHDLPSLVDALREVPNSDELLDALGNRRRRVVVRSLDRLPSDATLTLREAAIVCAAVEVDVSYRAVENSDYRRAYSALSTRDLTQLSLADVVVHTDGEVGRGPEFDTGAALVRAVDRVTADR